MNVPTIGANFDISGYNTVKCTGDPQKDAKNFADANNITIDEAKKILSGKFGDPVKKADSTDTSKAGATMVDDDAELDDDADLDVETTEEDDEVDDDGELEELEDEEEDDADDDDDTTTAIFSQSVIDTVEDKISEIEDDRTEIKNTYNKWAKSSYQYGGSKYNTAVKDYQADVDSLIDYIGSLDLSKLDSSTRSEIEEARDEAEKWSDRLAKAAKTSWWSDSTAQAKGSTAKKKTYSATETLISALQSAGL